MRNLLAIAGLALALGLGAASAQNVTKSLQGSQDPRGPVGLDSTNNAFFPAHINGNGNPSGALTMTQNCGGPNATSLLTSASTDVAGHFTPLASSCILEFSQAYLNAPACIFANTTSAGNSATITLTGVTLTNLTSALVYSYICIGNE